MRLTRSSFATAAALIALGACGGGADEMSEMQEAPAEAPLTQAEITAAVEELSCFLNNASMGEASERPSPLHQEPIVLGRGVAKVCYGAPSARDREVMGALVPYDELWRSGANEATAIHTSFPIEIGGVMLQPGSYSIFTRPGEEQWEVFVSPMYERWGIPITDEVQGSVIGSFMVMPRESDDMVEVMEYRWEPGGVDEGTLVLAWENTEIPMPIRRPTM